MSIQTQAFNSPIRHVGVVRSYARKSESFTRTILPTASTRSSAALFLFNVATLV